MNAPGRTKFDDNKFESQEMIESSKLLFFGDTYSNCKGFMVMSFGRKKHTTYNPTSPENSGVGTWTLVYFAI